MAGKSRNNTRQPYVKAAGGQKKNLRRINVVVTAQTLHHLEVIAAANGWGEKDLGKVIDKIMRTFIAQNTSSPTPNRKD